MTRQQLTERLADRRDYLTTLRIRHNANVEKIRETEQQIAHLEEQELLEVEKGLE